MDSVLRALGLGHFVEPQVRTSPARSLNESLVRRRILVDVGSQCGGPERSGFERFGAVERDGLDKAWHRQSVAAPPDGDPG